MKKTLAVMAIVTILLSLTLKVKAGEPCQPKVQAVLLTKILGFVRELGGTPKTEAIIGVVNGGPMLDMLKTVSSKAKDVSAIQISATDFGKANVVFLPVGTPDDAAQSAIAMAKSKNLLTVAGDPRFLFDYDATLTFHIVGGKPKMVVSLESAQSEGAKFAATFLKIAEKK